MDIWCVEIDEGRRVDRSVAASDFLESFLGDDVEEGSLAWLFGVEVDDGFLRRQVIQKDISVINP